MADSPHPPDASKPAPGNVEAGTPRFRPRDQFWPYAELNEEPSDEELARLDPDLQAALYENPAARAFSYTIVFQPFDGPAYGMAVDLARATSEYLEVRHGDRVSHRARFTPAQVLALRDLWQLVEHLEASEVLIDDRPVPYSRELWLPLLWFLLPR